MVITLGEECLCKKGCLEQRVEGLDDVFMLLLVCFNTLQLRSAHTGTTFYKEENCSAPLHQLPYA